LFFSCPPFKLIYLCAPLPPPFADAVTYEKKGYFVSKFLIYTLEYTHIILFAYIYNFIYHWGDPDTDWRIILGWIFRKWKGVVGTGWNWLRIGTGGGHM
jgi:hypothetical protein